MLFYQAKPILVEAIQYDGPDSVHKIMDVIGTQGVTNSEDGLYIFRFDPPLKVNKGEWVIISLVGDRLKACNPDHFNQLYEPVEKAN